MPLSLGLDASTQSLSALVIDTDSGVVVADVSINFGERLPQYGAPQGFIPSGAEGEVHADPRMWLDALELCLTELQSQCDLSQIRAIAGAGQQHGSVYLKRSWFDTIDQLTPERSLAEQVAPCLSRATSPIWMDTSTGVQCREIADALGGPQAVCDKSGSIPIERFTGPQIRRFYQEAPEAYAETARIHLVSSFLCSILCGADAPTDTGDGAGMNLLNIHAWQWDDELLAATAPELRDRLPAVVPGQTEVGKVSAYFVRKFGFAPETPITVFTGDNPSSLVGMGASSPGKVVISLGTSDTFFAAMPGIVADPDGFGHVFGNPQGGSMSLQCFVNGSLAREAVKHKFGYDWEQFSHALESTPPGNHGNLLVPFFRPEISPRVDLDSPLIFGVDDFSSWQNADAAIRGCVEGQFFNMKLRSDWMQLHPKVIYLTGGASKNTAIAQVIADIFQAKAQRLAVSSSVALGSAMRAAVNSLRADLASLELAFCAPDESVAAEPSVAPDHYAESLRRFDELLKR
ncbi:MAG: xylulokinase [Puniceicoccales bacterium]